MYVYVSLSMHSHIFNYKCYVLLVKLSLQSIVLTQSLLCQELSFFQEKMFVKIMFAFRSFQLADHHEKTAAFIMDIIKF